MNVHKLACKPAPHELLVNIHGSYPLTIPINPIPAIPTIWFRLAPLGTEGLHLKTLLMRTMSLLFARLYAN